MAKLIFNTVEDKTATESKIWTRQVNVDGQHPLTIRRIPFRAQNSPLLKGEVVNNKLVVRNVFFDFDESQSEAEKQVHVTQCSRI